MVTGERRQESENRAKYAELVVHKSSNSKRTVLQWRTVIDWSERDVWSCLSRWHVAPHVGYQLGWGRLSCALCIFGSVDQWASARELMPKQFERVANYEDEFGYTIDRKLNVIQMADKGCSTVKDADPEMTRQANTKDYFLPVLTDDWRLPAGAFQECGGPC